MPNQIAYLGPAGSFCAEAASQLNHGQLLAFPSISAVLQAIESSKARIGVVPVENSWEGGVHQTMDLLAASENLSIAGEIILPIQHLLLARPGTRLESIKCILSHPQALAQCGNFLTNACPEAEWVEVASTSDGAESVSLSLEAWAAVGSRAAAERYGLEVLAEEICDMPNNETRFLLIQKEDNPQSQGGKTSLVLQAIDHPGALYQLLHEFYIRGINLTRIESRPARTRLGEYRFFIDCLGSRLDQPLVDAFAALAQRTVFLKVLGSYPQAEQVD